MNVSKPELIEINESHLSALSIGARDILKRIVGPYIEALESKGDDVNVTEISIFPAQYNLLAMSIKRLKKLKYYPGSFMYRGYLVKQK